MRGLYAITDEKLTPYSNILSILRDTLEAGVKIVQLRDKTLSDGELEAIAKDILNLCKDYDAKLIIDDRVNLVAKIWADGLHIGKDDIKLKDARKILGKDKIIGVSCYGDVEYAHKMQEEGANYVAFGSFFNSTTKPNAKIVDKEVLMNAKEKLSIPICAIGGISSINAKELIEAGADMVAIISDLWNAKDLKAKIREYRYLS